MLTMWTLHQPYYYLICLKIMGTIKTLFVIELLLLDLKSLPREDENPLINPLANLKEQRCSPPYLKDIRACKTKNIAKTKVG